jgi:hypothetical protein
MTQSDIEKTLDRLQHEQQLLRNRVTILEALLPKPEVAPVSHPAPELNPPGGLYAAPETEVSLHCGVKEPEPSPSKLHGHPQVTAVPDISVGWIASGRK